MRLEVSDVATIVFSKRELWPLQIENDVWIQIDKGLLGIVHAPICATCMKVEPFPDALDCLRLALAVPVVSGDDLNRKSGRLGSISRGHYLENTNIVMSGA